MKMEMTLIGSLEIPNHPYRYQISKKTRKTGKPRYWTINGQGLYNGTMHYRVRSKLTKHFHKYFVDHIKQNMSGQIADFIKQYVGPDKGKLSVSLAIFEMHKKRLPDIGNMWIWTKWFEDALQEAGVIPDDNSDYIIESGRTRYIWVDKEEDRKLVFFFYLTND